MGKPIIGQNYFSLENINIFGDSLDFEALIEGIKQKDPKDRTGIEKEILRMYQKAEAKGEEFCMQKVKERLQEVYRKNRILVIAAFSIVALIVIRKIF